MQEPNIPQDAWYIASQLMDEPTTTGRQLLRLCRQFGVPMRQVREAVAYRVVKHMEDWGGHSPSIIPAIRALREAKRFVRSCA